ncbi:AraC family transcriptional regulator [Rapidithrix thailandica]|uniref:AraC family transcriptional regulator n=1 Tax=Rapidithrix thailandica TaxID=413964 RepID=A0AAW9S5J0_9BACT
MPTITSSLHIKNMVCDRCILVVRQVLEQAHLDVRHISLGEVEISGEISPAQREQLTQQLEALGFELIDDKKTKLINRIKTSIIQLVHYQSEDKPGHKNLSHFLEEKLGYEYSYLSNLFSSVEGTTIEKFNIAQKIEKAKELLIYNELTLSEIAWKLGYSSVQHLSNQFKKVTGLSPSHFKKIGEYKRKGLDQV